MEIKIAAEDAKSSNLLKTIGPGLVYAGTAVGVSHLVQSTRAGAMYGMGLVIFILLAFLAKYPGFLFAPRYSAATGLSILESYRRQGKSALYFYITATILTMFISAAAILLITAGLMEATLGVEIGILPISLGLSVGGMVLLITGHYHLLERVIKALVIMLTIATLVATASAIPMINWAVSGVLLPDEFEMATVLFIAALIGWMPTPFDVSIWQSTWTVAKIKDTGYTPSIKESKMDFDVGYIATAVLAICFVILGTAVMHNSGSAFESNAVLFAKQLIDIYEEALGPGSAALVGVAAIGVMFSTWLTLLDGFPRGLSEAVEILATNNASSSHNARAASETESKYYWPMMVIMICGGLIILAFFMSSFKGLVDLAATVSFLTAPIYAFLNQRAIHGKEVPSSARPSKLLCIWSNVGILALSIFALCYLYLSFVY